LMIAHMFFQEDLTGSVEGDWSLFTPSPLRAVEESKVVRNCFGGDSGTSSYASFDLATRTGIQEPVGFRDPLGLSTDKNEETFKRRRADEIKHGRIVMYATIGYTFPEHYKFPGYQSPSLDLKFEDEPNGLAARSKAQLLGWTQNDDHNEDAGNDDDDSDDDANDDLVDDDNGDNDDRDDDENDDDGNDDDDDKDDDCNSGSLSYASFNPAMRTGIQEPVGFRDLLGLSADKHEETSKRTANVTVSTTNRIANVTTPSNRVWKPALRGTSAAGGRGGGGGVGGGGSGGGAWKPALRMHIFKIQVLPAMLFA
jgi:hypothetical protein